MTPAPRPVPARKLPVEIVVKRAFLYSWESRSLLMPPYLIFAALTIVLELAAAYVSGPKNPLPEQAATIVEEVFSLALAVGMHRFVLLGESPPGLRFFRFDRHFVRYMLVTIILFILTLIAALPALNAVLAGGGAGLGLLGLMMVFAALIVVNRLSLLLPSAAIGDETPAKTVWEATQGNSFRLLATMLLTSLPFLIVDAILLRLKPDDDASLRAAEIKIVAGLMGPIQTIVLTVVLALCYDLLVRGNGPAASGRDR